MLDGLGDISLFRLAHQHVALHAFDQLQRNQAGRGVGVGRRPQGQDDLMPGLQVARLEDLAHFRDRGMRLAPVGARIGQHRHQRVAAAHGELALIGHRKLRGLDRAVFRKIGEPNRRRRAGFGQQRRLAGGLGRGMGHEAGEGQRRAGAHNGYQDKAFFHGLLLTISDRLRVLKEFPRMPRTQL